jgi:hypothetical protein
MTGKKEKGLLDQEIPLPPEIQEGLNSPEMQHDFAESEDQQELEYSSEMSNTSKQMRKTSACLLRIRWLDTMKLRSQYQYGWNTLSNQLEKLFALILVTRSELFQKVSDDEKVFVEGVQ